MFKINYTKKKKVYFKTSPVYINTINIEETRIYGYFGLYHAFQYRVNNQHPLASKIRLSDLKNSVYEFYDER